MESAKAASAVTESRMSAIVSEKKPISQPRSFTSWSARAKADVERAVVAGGEADAPVAWHARYYTAPAPPLRNAAAL